MSKKANKKKEEIVVKTDLPFEQLMKKALTTPLPKKMGKKGKK